jgi:hypothetical protein
VRVTHPLSTAPQALPRNTHRHNPTHIHGRRARKLVTVSRADTSTVDGVDDRITLVSIGHHPAISGARNGPMSLPQLDRSSMPTGPEDVKFLDLPIRARI